MCWLLIQYYGTSTKLPAKLPALHYVAAWVSTRVSTKTRIVLMGFWLHAHYCGESALCQQKCNVFLYISIPSISSQKPWLIYWMLITMCWYLMGVMSDGDTVSSTGNSPCRQSLSKSGIVTNNGQGIVLCYCSDLWTFTSCNGVMWYRLLHHDHQTKLCVF